MLKLKVQNIIKKSNKIIYGLYDDDEQILEATKIIVDKGYHINEVYSPFPVHGLDTAMGLKYSRIAVTSFLYGVMGAFFMLSSAFYYCWIIKWNQRVVQEQISKR